MRPLRACSFKVNNPLQISEVEEANDVEHDATSLSMQTLRYVHQLAEHLKQERQIIDEIVAGDENANALGKLLACDYIRCKPSVPSDWHPSSR